MTEAEEDITGLGGDTAQWKEDEAENKRKKNEAGITCDSQDLGCLPRTISRWIFVGEVDAHQEFETKS